MPESPDLSVLRVEILKALIGFVTVALLGGLVAIQFARVRYRRELNMSAAARFYEVYGTWFSTWKRWSAIKQAEEEVARLAKESQAPDVPTCSGRAADLPVRRRRGRQRGADAQSDHAGATSVLPNVEAARAELLIASAECEGKFEALLIKVAIERRLRRGEIDRLSRFRAGYQRLHESIEDNVRLRWSIQHGANDRYAYVSFKSSSVEFTTLVSRAGRAAPPWAPRRWRRNRSRLAVAQRNFVEMTSWRVPMGGDKDLWRTDKGAGSRELALRAWEHLPEVSSPWRAP